MAPLTVLAILETSGKTAGDAGTWGSNSSNVQARARRRAFFLAPIPDELADAPMDAPTFPGFKLVFEGLTCITQKARGDPSEQLCPQCKTGPQRFTHANDLK